jgi:uncharacterized protein (TIGR02246 family)
MSGSQFGDRVRRFLMMRSGAACALALALLFATAGPAPAQGDNPLHTASRVELDVVKVVVAQEKAWNAGDLEGYVKAYKDSPDTIFIGKDVSKGYAQILEDYKRNYYNRASMGTLTFSELEVHSLSDTFAVCIGKYHVERAKKDGGASDGQFSDVLEKTDQGWKIVLDHTT